MLFIASNHSNHSSNHSNPNTSNNNNNKINLNDISSSFLFSSSLEAVTQLSDNKAESNTSLGLEDSDNEYQKNEETNSQQSYSSTQDTCT